MSKASAASAMQSDPPAVDHAKAHGRQSGDDSISISSSSIISSMRSARSVVVGGGGEPRLLGVLVVHPSVVTALGGLTQLSNTLPPRLMPMTTPPRPHSDSLAVGGGSAVLSPPVMKYRSPNERKLLADSSVSSLCVRVRVCVFVCAT